MRPSCSAITAEMPRRRFNRPSPCRFLRLEVTTDRGYFCAMNNPRYKKISKSEQGDENLRREPLPGKVQDVFVSYFRVFSIVVGLVFIVKGMVGIIWRTLH